MKTIKGPGLFLGQFAGNEAPFDSLPAIAKWCAGCGYEAIQLPMWDKRFIDVEKAAGSKDYADELVGTARPARPRRSRARSGPCSSTPARRP